MNPKTKAKIYNTYNIISMYSFVPPINLVIKISVYKLINLKAQYNHQFKQNNG